MDSPIVPPPPPPAAPAPPAKRSRAGLWIGLTIAVVLLGGVLVALVLFVSKSAQRSDFSKTIAVRVDIQTIKTQLKLYESLNGFLPTTEQGLNALVAQPTTEPRPTKWYQLLKHEPRDPWGSLYIYRRPGRKDPATYDLFSPGPDRKPDTADDDWGE
ncbi:MAG TPA: type II secretion system major pseudopilin GspG [Chthoniobacterales bacterium]|jgi:general secretion pathway protein G